MNCSSFNYKSQGGIAVSANRCDGSQLLATVEPKQLIETNFYINSCEKCREYSVKSSPKSVYRVSCISEAHRCNGIYRDVAFEEVTVDIIRLFFQPANDLSTNKTMTSSEESKEFKTEVGESTMFKLSSVTSSSGPDVIVHNNDAPKNLENIDIPLENYEYAESTDKHFLFEICRVCANKNDHIIPIFEGEGAEHDLRNKIHKYLPIRVTENDTLPLQLCYHCAATILAWHELIEGCEDAEKRLLRMESELREKERSLSKDAEVLSSNERERINVTGEELVDDPEPITSNKQKEICTMEKEEPSVTVECAESPKCKERFGKSKKPFKIFLDAQNVQCEKSRNVKNEVRNEKHSTREDTDTIWRDALYASIENQLPNLESPIRGDEDLECSGEETFEKFEGIGLSAQLKTENSEKETRIPREDDAQRSLYPEEQESAPSDDSNNEGSRAKCNVCSRQFSHINDLHAHARQHKDLPEARKIYECVECTKSFRLKDSFVRHLRIHRDERPFTCHVCGKQFRDSGGLSRHLKDVHAKLKNFSCDICAKCFSSKATRDDHRRTHTGERPYVCDTCNKSFKSKACLYSHNKLHTNEFPHHCTYCNKKFRRRQEMLVHATTHTGEKNYSCDICYKRFRVKTEVVRHKLTHSDEKPFVCSKCGLRFRQNRYLNNHVKTRHVQSPKD